ncbi:hypothetical protein JEQ12_009926 [Ovis aries]|uniref:F-box domain-containing protein n=1 Tax=Ovis aries TaxID=9940 RepID=A0A836AN34_SHEEP|nr:hypothetical protein JEQ12_009926 [Ovis aries]
MADVGHTALCAFQDSDFFLKTPDLNSAVGVAIGFNSSHLQSIQSQASPTPLPPHKTPEWGQHQLQDDHLWISWSWKIQIALVFGSKILDYVFNLCEGKFDFLERLSDSLLLNIISYLDLEDIARLSQTSRRFAKLCMSEELWEQIVRSSCDHITPDMRALAQDLGWRRMYFTNKLQLQRHLRKRKQRQGSQRKQSALDAHVPAAGK